MRLEFQAETHTYRLGGSAVPNVTRVLAPLYDFDSVSRTVLDHKRDIGTALDDAIGLDISGTLDESTVDEQIGGRFEAWRRFRTQMNFQCQLLQCPVASKKYRFAGTPDAIGLIDGAEAIADWKATHAMHPAVALQTAAYAAAAVEMGFVRSSVKRYGVRFDEDGRYFVEPYKDASDFHIFLSLLSLHNWMERHRLLKEITK